MGRIKRDRVVSSGCIDSMLAALAIVDSSNWPRRIQSLAADASGTIDRTFPESHDSNSRTSNRDCHSSTPPHCNTQPASAQDAPCTSYLSSPMGSSGLEVALPTLSEKTRSIGILFEENPVSRGHSVYWDEVCHRICVHTTSFSGMYRD